MIASTVNVVSIFVLVACFVVSTSAVAFAAFKYGYDLGWEERQRDMTVPPLALRKTRQTMDREAEYGLHSGIDPLATGRQTSLP